MQTSELNIKDLGQSLLGVIVPHDFGSMWVGPGRGARVAGILLPIDRKADDIRFSSSPQIPSCPSNPS